MTGTPESINFAREMRSIAAVSPREAEILELLCRGYQDKEIAAALGISHGTLRTYMSRLFHKTKQSRRTGLVAAYMAIGLTRQPATHHS
jgi:DNA-binding CsgD family transcriptional regulator